MLQYLSALISRPGEGKQPKVHGVADTTINARADQFIGLPGVEYRLHGPYVPANGQANAMFALIGVALLVIQHDHFLWPYFVPQDRF